MSRSEGRFPGRWFGHESLDVFRLAKAFAIDLYRLTKRFPPEERFGLASQLRRAAVSVPANIAEGAARRSKKEFTRYLLTARGSVVELRLLLEIANATQSLDAKDFEECEANAERVFAMINGLLRHQEAARRNRES